MTTSEIIRQYLAQNLLGERVAAGISLDLNLLSTGLLDSIGILRLVLFLEERFGIRIDPEDISAGALETLGSISELVEHKLGRAATTTGQRPGLDPER